MRRIILELPSRTQVRFNGTFQPNTTQHQSLCYKELLQNNILHQRSNFMSAQMNRNNNTEHPAARGDRDAPQDQQPTQGPEPERGILLVDTSAQGLIELKRLYKESLSQMLEESEAFSRAIRSHLEGFDQSMNASIEQTSQQILHDLNSDAISKVEALRDGDQLSQILKMPDGWVPDDLSNPVQAHQFSETERYFYRSTDLLLDKLDSVIQKRGISRNRANELKSLINRTILKSARNDVSFTEGSFTKRPRKVVDLERAFKLDGRIEESVSLLDSPVEPSAASEPTSPAAIADAIIDSNESEATSQNDGRPITRVRLRFD